MSAQYHKPVLLDETLALLGDASSALDCTLGGGGHSAALLKLGVQVTAIDRDPQAIAQSSARFEKEIAAGKITIHLANFANVEELTFLRRKSFDAVLMDLGVSSRQLDDEGRGFTFRPGAPLDMRMGPDTRHDAASILNTASEQELSSLLRDFADEPRARRMAAELVRRRVREPYTTSDDLVRAIRAVLGPRSGPPDFARIFQGFRIAVNEEAAALAAALPALRELLKPSGVLVVISYHSGEDRVVKNAFRDWTKGCICPPRHPMCTCGLEPLGNTITRRAVIASDEERQGNPRSRSARLRAWRKNV